MTKETFDKLKAIENLLYCMAIEGHDPHPLKNALGEVEVIRQDVEPNTPPTNFSCGSCASAMVKRMYNLFKQYESTFI